MDVLALGASLTVMGALVMGLMAFYQATAHPRSSMERRLGHILGETGGGDAVAADFEALKPQKIGKTPILASLLQGKEWTAKIADDLEKADVRLTVSEYVAIRLLVAAVAAALAVVMVPKAPLNLLLAGGAGVGLFMAPNLLLSYAQKQRIKKLETQLIEALSLISNSLKAGFGLHQSFDLASRQLEHPISTEIRRMLHDVNVGLSNEEAMSAMARRSGSKDFDIVITAMLIQQSTGGNLAEILDNVAHTMRERIRIRGEIQTLTAQQMLTGYVIGGLPFVMIVLFSLLSPGYMTPLFTTTMGHLMLIGAAFLEFFGVMLIRKILSIEV
jgi:tight adherence protein B